MILHLASSLPPTRGFTPGRRPEGPLSTAPLDSHGARYRSNCQGPSDNADQEAGHKIVQGLLAGDATPQASDKFGNKPGL